MAFRRTEACRAVLLALLDDRGLRQDEVIGRATDVTRGLSGTGTDPATRPVVLHA